MTLDRAGCWDRSGGICACPNSNFLESDLTNMVETAFGRNLVGFASPLPTLHLDSRFRGNDRTEEVSA
jgi:hypothetical protein